MNNTNDIDDIVSWINDDSKVLTKKQKQKQQTPENKKPQTKKISKEMKDKLNKYNREKNPFYKKTLTEKIQLQKEYKNMLDQETLYKDDKMKNIMNTIQNMPEQEKQEYLKQLLTNNEIEIDKDKH